MSKEINESLIKIGLDSGVLNYVDHETPHHYFVASWIDEECLNEFARGIIEECIQVIHNEERTPPGFIMPKNALTYAYCIRKHFDLIESENDYK